MLEVYINPGTSRILSKGVDIRLSGIIVRFTVMGFKILMQIGVE